MIKVETEQMEQESDNMFESSMISLSINELSVNMSFVKQPFTTFQEMDKVEKFQKLRRTTTQLMGSCVDEIEHLDFYDEIEHLIR